MTPGVCIAGTAIPANMTKRSTYGSASRKPKVTLTCLLISSQTVGPCRLDGPCWWRKSRSGGRGCYDRDQAVATSLRDRRGAYGGCKHRLPLLRHRSQQQLPRSTETGGSGRNLNALFPFRPFFFFGFKCDRFPRSVRHSIDKSFTTIYGVHSMPRVLPRPRRRAETPDSIFGSGKILISLGIWEKMNTGWWWR